MFRCTYHKEELAPWLENLVEQGHSVRLIGHPVQAGEGGDLKAGGSWQEEG